MKPQRHLHVMGLFFLLPLASVGVSAAEPTSNGSLDQKIFHTETDSNLEWVIDKERYTWYLKPNTVQYIHNVWTYETNSYGLRDVEFPLKKPPGSLRIVCLGDSVTYGAGVSFDQTYGQQLERMLKAHRWDVKVINAGIGSHRAWHGLERLENHIIRFEPDVVTVCFGFNDGVLQPQTLWDEWRKRLAAERPGDEPTHSVSTRPAVPGPDGLMPSVPIDEYADHLEAIVRQIRERTKARVYLLTFTVITDDYHRTDWTAAIRDRQRAIYDEYRERMRAVGRAMDVPVVDVYPRFASAKEPLIFPDGIHPNARGLRIYAEELYKQIRQDLGL